MNVAEHGYSLRAWLDIGAYIQMTSPISAATSSVGKRKEAPAVYH